MDDDDYNGEDGDDCDDHRTMWGDKDDDEDDDEDDGIRRHRSNAGLHRGEAVRAAA